MKINKKLIDYSKILYSNDAGSTVADLSDDVSNYEYIEIYYKNNDNQYGYIKVLNPLNKGISIITAYANQNIIYEKYARATIENTKITLLNIRQLMLPNGTVSTGDYILITKVIGYK